MLKVEETTKSIIGAGMEVLNTLRPGLDEKLYERALALEFKRRGCQVNQQKIYSVEYKGEIIGDLIPDLIVDNSVIVETKVATEIHDVHIAQVLGYLNITGLEVEIILNFKSSKLTWKRLTTENKSAISV